MAQFCLFYQAWGGELVMEVFSGVVAGVVMAVVWVGATVLGLLPGAVGFGLILLTTTAFVGYFDKIDANRSQIDNKQSSFEDSNKGYIEGQIRLNERNKSQTK